MTFNQWFNEHLKTATGNGWSVADIEAAWQAAERQALERAAQVLEADKSGWNNQSRAADIIDACADTIRALHDAQNGAEKTDASE